MAAAAVLTPLVRPAKAPDDVRDCSKRNRYEEDGGEEPLHDLDGASANKPPCLALRAPILLLPFMFILLLKGRCGTSTSWMLHIVGGEIGRTNGMRTSVSWARWIYAASVSSSNKSLCVPSGAKRCMYMYIYPAGQWVRQCGARRRAQWVGQYWVRPSKLTQNRIRK